MNIDLLRTAARTIFRNWFGEGDVSNCYLERWEPVNIELRNQQFVNIYLPGSWAATPLPPNAKFYAEGDGRHSNLSSILNGDMVRYRVSTVEDLTYVVSLMAPRIGKKPQP